MAREIVIQVRVNKDEDRIIRQRAAQLGLPIAEYIRDLVLYEADNKNIAFRPGVVKPSVM